MSFRFVGLIVVVLLVVGGVAFLTLNPAEAPLDSAPAITLAPEPAPPDVDLSDKFIERLIAEDEGIKAALEGGLPAGAAANEEEAESAKPPKSDSDVLYELMAPWVYIKHRQANELSQAQFRNMNDQRTTPWLPLGASFASATILSLDADKAVVSLGDATQELLYVPENPPPFDPSVPRTPEQIADAQRRYKEVYYKRFKVMGQKYNELAGRPRDFVIPPKEERETQINQYFELMEERLENAQPVTLPPEALIDPNTLDEGRRAVYEKYLQTLQRTPEEIRADVEAYRQKMLDNLNKEGAPQSSQ